MGFLFKRKLDHELEVQKAYLQHTSAVHARQVDALVTLYRYLREAHAYLQLMSATATFEGEKPETYPGKFATVVVSARDDFAISRFLMPASLAERCDAFFRTLFEGHFHLGVARHPMTPNGDERAGQFDRARSVAYKELPSLLREIEAEARGVIHGRLS